MRLSHIEIENFKGIGTKQSIDLAPITLLFGPNSAGKSTILQALHYLREILERNNPDPDQTIAGGLTDLGGFAKLVHNHDLNRAIRIKVRIDMTDDQGNERLPLNSGSRLGDQDFAKLGIRYLVGENTELRDYAVVQEIGLGIEVRWSDLINGPYVSSISAELDGEPVADIMSPAQPGRARLSNLRFEHPLLQAIVDPDIDQDLPEFSETDGSDELGYLEVETPLKEQFFDLSRLMAAPRSSDDANNTRTSGERRAIVQQRADLVNKANSALPNFKPEYDADDLNNSSFAVAVATKIGALPDLDKSLELDLRDIDPRDVEDIEADTLDLVKVPGSGWSWRVVDMVAGRRRGLSELLDELVLGPARIVRDYLSSMTYVGPLREIPSRGYKPRLSPDESRWAQGLAAWDLLHTQNDDELLDSVNAWMSSEERLQTGYRLDKIQSKQIPTTSGFHQLFQRGIDEDDLGDLQELYATLATTTEIGLLDVNRGVLVAPRDVGVGISQMVPVVVACLMDPKGLVAIEQPELHIHPAIQVGMGDLFIEATQGPQPAIGAERTLLVETHSEHIMLRLLRRIREKNDGTLPPGVMGLSPPDVSVVYVEATESGPNFKTQRVDQDGEFLGSWPNGFFRERSKELF